MLKHDELIATYIRLRDKKASIKAAYDAEVAKVDKVLDKIEQKFLAHFVESGSDTVTVRGIGTAYRATRVSYSVADRDNYLGWVMKDPEERLMFLEARVAKKNVDQYVETNGDLPPGLNCNKAAYVNVNRG